MFPTFTFWTELPVFHKLLSPCPKASLFTSSPSGRLKVCYDYLCPRPTFCLPADVGLLLLYGGCPQVFLYLPKQLSARAIQLMVQVVLTASVRIASAMLAGILVTLWCATLAGICLRHFCDPPCCGMSQPMSALSTTMWLTFTTCVASRRYRFRVSAC